MADVNVLLHIQQGTGQGDNTPPANDPSKSENGWLRAKQQDANGGWTVDSPYWFCYSGGNGANAGNGGVDGGEVDLPSGGSFKISPSGNEVLHQVTINESATTFPPGKTSYYSPNPPTIASDGTCTVTDSEHTDPAGTTDSFDVYAYFNNSANAALLRCDPIIRNKGSNN